MYVISLDHYLDARGTIANARGSGRKMAVFATAVVAFASNAHRPVTAPLLTCFECRDPEEGVADIGITETGLVTWHCHACGSEGQISNWRGTFWDLSGVISGN